MTGLYPRIAAGAAIVAAVWGGIAWLQSRSEGIGEDRVRAEWREVDRVEAEARQSDARQQRQFNDQQAGKQAIELAALNTQLGNANAQIAKLSGRPCLSAGTVRMLNDIGAPAGIEPVRAAARDSAGAPEPSASDRDVGRALAVCRAGYAGVSGQLNKILDIEERRHTTSQAVSVDPETAK